MIYMVRITPNQEQGEDALDNLIFLTSCIRSKEQENYVIRELEKMGVFD